MENKILKVETVETIYIIFDENKTFSYRENPTIHYGYWF